MRTQQTVTSRATLGRLGATQGNFIYTVDADGNWIATPNPNAGQPTADSSGSVATSAGTNYTAQQNAALVSNPTGTSVTGATDNFNPNFYSTQTAAAKYAAALGGQVVIDPNSAGINGTQMLAIKLPDGTVVNAGAIGSILGNDAMFPGSTTKSGEIAKLFGAAYNPALATALTTGTPIDLTPAAAPAPGYNPTPLQQSYSAAPAAAAKAAAAQPQAAAPQSAVIVPTYRPTLTFENLTTGDNSTVVAGRDQWRISISGAAPGAAIVATGSKNAGPASQTTYGKTDSSGNWSMTGSSAAADIGTWSFTWKAGPDVPPMAARRLRGLGRLGDAANLTFQIVAAPPAGSSSGGSSSGGSSSGGSSSGSSSGTGTTGTSSGTTGTSSDTINAGSDQGTADAGLFASVTTAAESLPHAWLWAAAAAAALLLMSKKGKR